MIRGVRRVCASALTLLLLGCFSPTGSVWSSTDSDANTTITPTTVTTTSVSATIGTSDASQSTGTTATLTSVSDTSATSDSSTTGTTDTSSTTDGTTCGDGTLQVGEACDDGPQNGPTRPCRGDCTLAVCGDANVCDQCQPAELCDDGNQIADDGCDLECQPTPCGNGILDANEECDDSNHIAFDGCSPRCLLERQYIFVSSIKGPGDAGVVAADLLCAGLAATKLNTRRKFVAWLSTAVTPAFLRIGVSPFPYVTPSGTLIAANTIDLLDGSLAAPIAEAEDGVAQPTSLACDGISGVWTGTNAKGMLGPDNCLDWSTTEGEGLTGNFALTDLGWTRACNLLCITALHVYCVEQVI